VLTARVHRARQSRASRLKRRPARFKQSEAFSFQVRPTTSREPTGLWNAIVGNGGQESACGWCRTRWGAVPGRSAPRVLLEAVNDPDRAPPSARSTRMMTMGKIDVAAIEKAWRG
jgi:predicted 3-demethylubiquinone-9 3-methyltransferase (glyoxalase superfamily)